jgi:hypothetical protein
MTEEMPSAEFAAWHVYFARLNQKLEMERLRGGR